MKDRICKTQCVKRNQIITRHVPLLDFRETGYPLKLGVFIRTNQKEEVKDYLSSHPNLNTLLRISGDYDYYAEILFRDMADYQDFRDELDKTGNVTKISANFLTDVKLEVFEVQGEK